MQARSRAVREGEIMTLAGGSLSNVVQELELELNLAQHTLQCCPKEGLCRTTSIRTCLPPTTPPNTCTLTSHLQSCIVDQPKDTPTQVHLGGALRVASTFAEILLLEYANGFPLFEVGWGRITREQMTAVFRLHTKAFRLEQRTPYMAKLQGSMLLRKMLLALKDETDGETGTAPPGAKFVAYVGHDTNIANVAGMLNLSWLQAGYQENQTPPAGALIFELRQTDNERASVRLLRRAIARQHAPPDRHNRDADTSADTRMPRTATARSNEFATLVASKLDPNRDPTVDPGCSQ